MSQFFREIAANEQESEIIRLRCYAWPRKLKKMTTALSQKAKDPSKGLYFSLAPCDAFKRKESLITKYIHFDNKKRQKIILKFISVLKQDLV